ncbi:hypothetical protein BH11ACT4_BH11ACT4_02710 [soil metagenome]
MSITRNGKRKLAALLVTPALLLAFTACSSAPAGSGPGGSTPPPASMSASDWRVAFAGCMREQGIDMTDPGDGGQGVSITGSNQDAMAAAAQKCQAELGPIPPLSQAEQDAQDAESQKTMLAAAKCLRDNGVDVADPKPGDTVKVPDGTPQDVLDKCGVGGTQGAARPIGG